MTDVSLSVYRQARKGHENTVLERDFQGFLRKAVRIKRIDITAAIRALDSKQCIAHKLTSVYNLAQSSL